MSVAGQEEEMAIAQPAFGAPIGLHIQYIRENSAPRLAGAEAAANDFHRYVISLINHPTTPKAAYTPIIRALHDQLPVLQVPQQQTMLRRIRAIIGKNKYTIPRLGADLLHDIDGQATTAPNAGPGRSRISQIDFLVARTTALGGVATADTFRPFTNNPGRITRELTEYGIDTTPFVSFPLSDVGIQDLNNFLASINCVGVAYDCCFRNLFEKGLRVPAYFANVASKFDASVKPSRGAIEQLTQRTTEFSYDARPIQFNNFYADIGLQMSNDGSGNHVSITDNAAEIAQCTCAAGISINSICNKIGLGACRGAGSAGKELRISAAQAGANNHILMLKPAGDVGLSMIPLEKKLNRQLVALISSDSFMMQLCQEKVDVLIRVASSESPTVDVHVFDPALKIPNYQRVHANILAVELLPIEDIVANTALQGVSALYQRVKGVVGSHASFVFKHFDEDLAECAQSVVDMYNRLSAIRGRIPAGGSAEAIPGVDYGEFCGLQSQDVPTFLLSQFKQCLTQRLRAFMALATQLSSLDVQLRGQNVGASFAALQAMCDTLNSFLEAKYYPDPAVRQVAVAAIMASFWLGIERIADIPAPYDSAHRGLRIVQNSIPISYGSIMDSGETTRAILDDLPADETLTTRAVINGRQFGAYSAALAAAPGAAYIATLTGRGEKQIIPLGPRKVKQGLLSDLARITHAINPTAIELVEFEEEGAPPDNDPDAVGNGAEGGAPAPQPAAAGGGGAAEEKPVLRGRGRTRVRCAVPVIDQPDMFRGLWYRDSDATLFAPPVGDYEPIITEEVATDVMIVRLLNEMSKDAGGLEPDFTSFVQNITTLLEQGLGARIASVLYALFVSPSLPTHFIRYAIPPALYTILLERVAALVGQAYPAGGVAGIEQRVGVPPPGGGLLSGGEEPRNLQGVPRRRRWSEFKKGAPAAAASVMRLDSLAVPPSAAAGGGGGEGWRYVGRSSVLPEEEGVPEKPAALGGAGTRRRRANTNENYASDTTVSLEEDTFMGKRGKVYTGRGGARTHRRRRRITRRRRSSSATAARRRRTIRRRR